MLILYIFLASLQNHPFYVHVHVFTWKKERCARAIICASVTYNKYLRVVNIDHIDDCYPFLYSPELGESFLGEDGDILLLILASVDE